MFDRYKTTLGGLRRRSRLRTLAPQYGVDFTSNDYLGLAGSARLAAAVSSAIEQGGAAGAGGSRLLRGNHGVHEVLEAEAAALFGSEKALYFGSGFAANVALFSCLPRRNDLIVYDELIHASVHDGVSLGKAQAVAVRHNDVGAFDEAIRCWRAAGGSGHPWIAVESLFSMDGDRAPLAELLQVAERHDGFLVVDEAHATGVLGSHGRGLVSSLPGTDRHITLHTCGKALGVSGALLCLPGVLADYMINHARNFIYSTAPSPLIAAAVREALLMVEDEPERRRHLDILRNFTANLLSSRLGITPSGSHIQPIMIGDNARAMRIAGRLRSEGFDIRAIRPPTVPEGTARLRLSITLNVDEEQIAAMTERLAVAIEEDRP
jgi:8-amino-7-oxononanoate synthase